MIKPIAIVLFSIVAAAGCKKEAADKAANKPAVSEPAKAADKPADKPADTAVVATVAPAAGAFPVGKYDLDAGHSVFLWKVRHMGAGYTYGWFKDVAGSVTVDADPTKQSLELTVQTASIDSRDQKRDDHLRGPDFFNAKQFPTITFKSTKVEPGAAGALSVTGDLTIKGVTKSITTQVTPLGTGVNPYKQTMVGYETTLVINRLDYGVAFMPEMLGNEVALTIGIEATKK